MIQKPFGSWLIAILFFILSGNIQANSLADKLEVLRQQHLEALQLSLSDPDKGRRAHGRVASQLESIVGEEAVNQGVLAYNIGNSWFHAGRYGESILWYRRAEVLGFESPQLVQNLDFVRSKRLDNLPDRFGPQWLSQLYLWSSYNIWLLVCALVYLLFWWQFWRWMQKGAAERERFILASCAMGLVLASLFFLRVYEPEASQGVILASEVDARKGPGRAYAPAFIQPLNAGTEVLFLQHQNDWLEVALSDGHVAWLPEDSLEPIEY